MKILVIGASGYIGSAVTSALLQNGHQILASCGSAGSRLTMMSKGMDVVFIDFSMQSSVDSAISCVDAIIFSAELGSAEANGLAVRSILKGLQGSNKKFLFTSGTGVLFDEPRGVYSEKQYAENDIITPIVQQAARVHIENDVLAACKKGIKANVIRPPMLHGRGGSQHLSVLVNYAKERQTLRYIGAGENRWSNLHIDDLASLYVCAMKFDGAGHILHGTASEVSMIDLMQSLANRFGGSTESINFDVAKRELPSLALVTACNCRSSSVLTQHLLGWHPENQDDIFKTIENTSNWIYFTK